MTKKELISKYGGTTKDWRKVGKAWVYKNVVIPADSTAQFLGEAIIEGGTIRGGTIWGGDIMGGDIRGGTIWGGTIWGGEWKNPPLFLSGSKFTLCNAKPGYLQIGCKCETYAWWKKNGLALAKENNFTEAEIKEYTAYLKMFMEVGK